MTIEAAAACLAADQNAQLDDSFSENLGEVILRLEQLGLVLRAFD